MFMIMMQLLTHVRNLFCFSASFYAKRPDRSNELLQQSDVITTSIEDISQSTQPLVRQIQKLPERVKKIIDMIPHQEAGNYSLFFMTILSSKKLSVYLIYELMLSR